MTKFFPVLFFLGLLATVAHAQDPRIAPTRIYNLQPPVANACISSPFGFRHAIGFLPAGPHNGLDLPAPAGAPVFAVADGRVLAVHRRGPGGLELFLTHGGGNLVTLYAHLGSIAPAIAMGKTNIAAGERIGVVGLSGVTFGMHLYFEVMIDGRPVDPAPLLHLQPCERGSPRQLDARTQPTQRALLQHDVAAVSAHDIARNRQP